MSNLRHVKLLLKAFQVAPEIRCFRVPRCCVRGNANSVRFRTLSDTEFLSPLPKHISTAGNSSKPYWDSKTENMEKNQRERAGTTGSSPRPTQDNKVGDLDFYMKSRYNAENLGGSEDEFEQEDTSADLVHDKAAEAERCWELKVNVDGKFENIVGVLANPHVLEAAYERLNVKRRNWTLGENDLEVSHISKGDRAARSKNIDWTWFKQAAQQLKSGSYLFKPVRQVEVSRRGRGEARHVTLVSQKDQVVQEALREILERIYEPMFSVNSHGFRPGTSVHSALKSIKYGWKRIAWFLQFDVRKSDDALVQNRLMHILAERIHDQLFLDAIRQMFEAQVIRVDTFADEEMPHGSVLSPLLGNIYLHQLDMEINRIIKEVNAESAIDDPSQGTRDAEHEKQMVHREAT